MADLAQISFKTDQTLPGLQQNYIFELITMKANPVSIPDLAHKAHVNYY